MKPIVGNETTMHANDMHNKSMVVPYSLLPQ